MILNEGIEGISSSCFSGCESLTTIEIPGSVTSIGSYAFQNCKNLQTVILNEGIEEISENVFSGCESLTTLEIPGSVTSIEKNMFSGCTNLQTVILQEGIEEISSDCFEDCETLTTIEIPGSVKIIDSGTFFGCKNLQTVILNEGIEEISSGSFSGCESLTTIEIPGSVKIIESYMFSGCTNLQTVILNEGTEEISSYSFSGCESLTTIEIPGSVKIIESYMFSGCTNLQTVILNEGIEEISSGCFSGCESLRTIEIPGSVKIIEKNTFRNCINLQAVILNEGTEEISSYSFYGCESLTAIEIPESVTSIGTYAFYNCTNLQTAILNEGIGEIPSYSFYGCESLTAIEIPENVTKIGTYAFCNCTNLQSVILNDGITTISANCFAGCTSLTEIVIPDSVTSIAEGALFGCDNLKKITLPFVGKSASASGKTGLFGYIFGSGEDTDTAQYYTTSGVYYSCIPRTLESVTVTTDTTIPYGAFSNCTNIKEINLLANVTSIAKWAFYNCTGLENITFMGDAPSSINSAAFEGCGELTANILEDNTTWTDSKKQNYGAEKINWTSKNKTDLVAKISSVKIGLGDKIAVKFMVTLDDSVSDDDYMLVTVNGETTRIYVKDTTVETSSLTGEEKHVFVCRVNAKEMTSDITVQMVVGGTAGSEVTYSVEKYANAILGLESGTYEAEKAMVRAMLNYGGYAQTYFGSENELANEDLYEEADDPVLNLGTLDLEEYAPIGTNVSKITATLLLESETELRVYFTPEDGRTLDDYTFEVSGNKVVTTGTKDGKYYVAITGIRADELQDMYTVTIRLTDTQEVFASVTYGAMSYVRTVLNNSSDVDLQNLVKALYLYNQAALDYLN